MMSREQGFTLIELLIVVVIIGILAAIAIPRFRNSKEQAFVATMKADLRNLATAQEAYLYDNATYYDGAIPSGQLTYNPSTGVSVALQDVSTMGWSAKATHSNTSRACALFIGGAAPLAPAVNEGEVQCSP